MQVRQHGAPVEVVSFPWLGVSESGLAVKEGVGFCQGALCTPPSPLHPSVPIGLCCVTLGGALPSLTLPLGCPCLTSCPAGDFSFLL